MNESDIKKIEQELLKQYVTEPINLENMISDTATKAARDIVFGKGTATFEFLDSIFVARSRRTIKGIFLVISNEKTRDMAGNKYIPYTMQCEIDNNFSLVENYKAAFETFLRHITGNDRPEIED